MLLKAMEVREEIRIKVLPSTELRQRSLLTDCPSLPTVTSHASIIPVTLRTAGGRCLLQYTHLQKCLSACGRAKFGLAYVPIREEEQR